MVMPFDGDDADNDEKNPRSYIFYGPIKPSSLHCNVKERDIKLTTLWLN